MRKVFRVQATTDLVVTALLLNDWQQVWVSPVLRDDHYKRIYAARQRTLTALWSWVPSIGKQVQLFTSNDDVSKWVKNSPVRRKNSKQTFLFHITRCKTNALPRLYLHGGSNHWGFVRLPKVVPSYRGRDKETIVSLLAVFCCNLDQQMHTLVHSSGRRYLRGIRKWIKWHSDSCRETDSLLIVIIDQQRNVKKVMTFKVILTLTNYYSHTEV